MQSNRGKNTLPEVAVRKELFSRGYRFRVNCRPVPNLRRTADIVFSRKKIAIFIDGCFWHSCPRHGTSPKTNASFWREKLERNVQRDRETIQALRKTGWRSVRIWEHETPQQAADRIERLLVR